MHLPVGGHPLAGWTEQDGGVVGTPRFVGGLRERAHQYRDLQLAGEVRKTIRPGSRDALRLRSLFTLGLEEHHALGQGHELRARAGRVSHQCFRRGQVRGDVLARAHLADRRGDRSPTHRFLPFVFVAPGFDSPSAKACFDGQGHRSKMPHSPQRGLRASQVRRPWKMMRSVVLTQRSLRHDLHQVFLDVDRIIVLRESEPRGEP